jgi:hypothetical protein
MINKFYTIISFVLISFLSNAQEKSDPVTININTNIPYTQCVLAYCFGANKYSVETITLDKFGAGSFVDKKGIITGGIYMIIFPKKENKYLELILSGDEKNIELFVNDNNFYEPTFKNSRENEIFYDDIKTSQPLFLEISKLRKEYDKAENKITKDSIKNKMIGIETTLKNKRLKIINENPGSLYSNILNVMKDIDIPEPTDKNDSLFKFYYYKNHYFDYVDFNDDRLLFTPVFIDKFKYYFDKIIIKHTDTIKNEIDFVLSKIKNPNSKINRYCLATLLNDFANSKIMGHEELYVYLVKNYYANGKAPWVAPADLKRMKEDVDKISANKIVEIKTIPIDQYLGF